MRKKCQYLELFWSASSRIWTEYYLVRMQKMRSRIALNTDTFHAVNDKMIGWYDGMMVKVIPTRFRNLVCSCSQQIICFCKYNTKNPSLIVNTEALKNDRKTKFYVANVNTIWEREQHHFFITKKIYSKKLLRNIYPSNVIFDI